MVYKIVSCNRTIEAASRYEMEKIESAKSRKTIIYDSTNKVDSPR